MMQVIIIVLFVGLWLLIGKIKIERGNVFGKRIPPFYRISCGLYYIGYRMLKKTAYYRNLEKKLYVLYPNHEKSYLVKQFICYKGMWVLLIIFCGCLLSLGIQVQEKDDKKTVQSLNRDTYWGDEHNEYLHVSVDGIMKEEPFQFRIKEQVYSEEEIQTLLQKKAEKLETLIRNKNKSLDHVTTDLNLIRKIPDTDIEVLWEIDNNNVIDYDGKLYRESLSKEGTLVQLTATLSYQKQSYMYSFCVYVYEEELSENEAFRKELQKEVEERNDNDRTSSILQLPTTINGKKIIFYRSVPKYAGKTIGIAFICAVLLFFVKDERLKKQIEIRKSQLLADYPEIVSKLTLLLGAGMTIRGAIEKMADDYSESKQGRAFKKRYAYDELLLVCREMQSGVSEKAAIEKLGKRCQLTCYLKLSTVLQQNLKKGSERLAELLGCEVSDAFQKRKNIARKAGEEAGTKLLAPMLVMLIIVLVILILPACMSFQM